MVGHRMSNTKIWALSIIGILCVWFLAVSKSSLTPVVVAMSLAYFIYPLVKWMQKWLRLKHKIIAVTLTLVMILTVFVILINSILPPLINQITRFAREFSGYSARFLELMDSFEDYFTAIGLDSRITGQFDDMLQQVITMVGNALMGFASSVIGYVARFTDFVIIVILMFYFLLDGEDMVAYVVSHLPDSLRHGCERVIEGIEGVIWGFMKNQVIISTIHGLACYLSFLLIRLPFAGLLGILSGVLNMIPYFGSIIASLVAILVALFYFGAQKGILTGMIVLTLNMVLGNIITPRLQAKTLGIHPVLVIASLLVCNYMWGAVGMFFAVPMLGLAFMAAKEVLAIVRTL